METRPIKGIFMCIKTISHKRDSDDGNTRIYVLEIPTGKLFDGKLKNEVVRALELRDSISVDITDLNPVDDAREVFNSSRYDIQPVDYFNRPIDSRLV
jgi:hypothetical protein